MKNTEMLDQTMPEESSQNKEQDASSGEGVKLHMGIAEQGKVYALEGDHEKALLYYREAMKMAIQAGDPEVFFRHYLECTVEALEQTGSYNEVLSYCDKALNFYEENPPPNPMAQMDHAHLHQRRAVALMMLEQQDGAKEAFRQALNSAREVGSIQRDTLPLTQTLLRWLETGLRVDTSRVRDEQKRHAYFSVREDTVNPELAVKLPHEDALAAAGRLGG